MATEHQYEDFGQLDMCRICGHILQDGQPDNHNCPGVPQTSAEAVAAHAVRETLRFLANLPEDAPEEAQRPEVVEMAPDIFEAFPGGAPARGMGFLVGVSIVSVPFLVDMAARVIDQKGSPMMTFSRIPGGV